MSFFLRVSFAVVLFTLGSSTPGFAIPSPELVVGSISSLSQIFAVASGLFGSAAVIGFGARQTRTSNLSRYLTVAALALLCLSGGLNAYQYLQAGTVQRERLEAALVRPSNMPGMPIADPTLKELSYSQQLNHPLGITTQEGEKLLEQATSGQASDVVFIDVREHAETEMGSLQNATVLRYADIKLDQFKAQIAGKRAILYCHNGNRSSETCAALAALGIDCRFVVGGLEKWLAEGRHIAGFEGRTLDTLRAIPHYANDRVLLDTPDVKRLVEKDDAYFLDVRYPGEFAKGHLPDARNLTVRTTTTEDLKKIVAELPRRPIIVPCYDRRSCFFGEVIGLELTQAGHDYRGRYTVPWEYFTLPAAPPHVVAFQQATSRGMWAKAISRVATGLQAMSDRMGLAFAIIALALLSRLIILPFSLKAERDQAVTHRLAPEFDSLRERLRDDPVRQSRAIRSFYRQNGLTPERNLIALLFLPALALCVSAVQEVASRTDVPVLWFQHVAERDVTLVLPLIFGLLVATYLHVSFGRSGRRIAAIWLVGLPVFAAMAALLSAAANIYMVASMALLFGQRWLVQKPWRNLRWSSRGSSGVVSLAQAGALPGCGNKAFRLGQMKQLGIPVPDGVVLTSAFLAEFAGMSAAKRQSSLEQIWVRVGAERVAVRSSGAAEDGAEHSFAGVFDSVIDVERGQLEDAIRRVIKSFTAARAVSYGQGGGAANIIVQRMVHAEYAGVLFTRDPSSSGQSMIEMVEGTAEDLVSGAAVPVGFRHGRYSHTLIGDKTPPIDLQLLLALGVEAEAAFGAPQDIEWTYRDGAFIIVQSRDITSVMDDALEDERNRILALAAGSAPDEKVFAQTEMSELLPKPTRLSLSLMQSIWQPGGSVDLACRSLGLRYGAEEDSRDYLVTIFGRLYVDLREERVRAPRISSLAARRLRRSADRLASTFKQEFLPTLEANLSLLEVADFQGLPTDVLLETLAKVRHSFLTQTYAQVDAINIAGAFYMGEAQLCLDKIGLDPAVAFGQVRKTQAALKAEEALALSGDARAALIARTFGHRAPFDYELSCPRYAETPELLLPIAQGAIAGKAAEEGSIDMPPDVRDVVERARLFQSLKEDAKHQAARELAVLRRLVLAVGQHFGLGGLVFHLTFDEISSLTAEEAHVLASIREAAGAQLYSVRMPTVLTLADLETAKLGAARDPSQTGGRLAGTRVSGGHAVEGRALVVTEENVAEAIARLQAGDILVTSMVSPAWLPYFEKLGGVAAEIGGWLSHTAILAREHDLTMLVGVADLAMIPDGAIVRLELDGGISLVLGDSEMMAAE